MTKCNREALTFSSLFRRRISADFDGGRLTSDAGGVLLREVDRRIGLTKALAECIADPRDPDKVIHNVQTLLAQRIYGIALGYEDLNDHETLRTDPVMQVLAEQPPDPSRPLASPATLCRFENRITRQSLARMSGVWVDQFIASFKRAPKKLVLDFDPTDDLVHGDQEKKFFHGYYDHDCFLPLYVFCGERLLCAYLRPANIDGALHTRAILRLLVNRLRKAWPKVRIIFRADAGLCRWKTLKYCDEHDIGYVVGLTGNAVLKRVASPGMALAHSQFVMTGEKQRDFYEASYAAKTWDRKRRVIIKAEHLEKGPNTRFVVTNLDHPPPEIYDDWYAPRGEMENRIKEQQLGLFADRTSCHKFLANQFRLQLASAAYVLIEHLRREGLHGTELARAQVSTIRSKLFKIAARVRISVRRIVFHLSGNYPYPQILQRLTARLTPG